MGNNEKMSLRAQRSNPEYKFNQTWIAAVVTLPRNDKIYSDGSRTAIVILIKANTAYVRRYCGKL